MGLDLKGTYLKQNKPQGKIVRCASRVEAFIGLEDSISMEGWVIVTREAEIDVVKP